MLLLPQVTLIQSNQSNTNILTQYNSLSVRIADNKMICDVVFLARGDQDARKRYVSFYVELSR